METNTIDRDATAKVYNKLQEITDYEGFLAVVDSDELKKTKFDESSFVLMKTIATQLDEKSFFEFAQDPEKGLDNHALKLSPEQMEAARGGLFALIFAACVLFGAGLLVGVPLGGNSIGRRERKGKL